MCMISFVSTSENHRKFWLVYRKKGLLLLAKFSPVLPGDEHHRLISYVGYIAPDKDFDKLGICPLYF